MNLSVSPGVVNLYRVLFNSTLGMDGITKLTVVLEVVECDADEVDSYDREWVDTKHRAHENFRRTLGIKHQKLADDQTNLRVLEEMLEDLVADQAGQGFVSRNLRHSKISDDKPLPLTTNIDAPPLRHQRLPGHHWVMVGLAGTTEYDQRKVLQWAPGARVWVASGLVGSGGTTEYGQKSPPNIKIKWLEAIAEPRT